MSTIDPEPWLVLLHAAGLGPTRAIKLLQTACLQPAEILKLNRSELRSYGLPDECIQSLHCPDPVRIKKNLEWLQQADHHLLVYGSAQYPQLLESISDPPLCLFVDGQPRVLHHPQMAMVGSRNPSPQGCENAAAFAHFLASTGFAITSGLARGIDAASHKGALAAGGFTVAVCGTGLDVNYPRQHASLKHTIRESGALVSEFPSGTPPHKANFPRRNRIISGLSVGTLVVEAAHRSGSLITARLAGEQGREIFALPGSIHNPVARGCHRLIRDGARLVETGRDIIEELGNLTRTLLPDDHPDPAEPPQRFTLPITDYDKLLQCMGHEPSSIDQLCQRSGLTAEEVCSMLLNMELRGYAKVTLGGRYLRSI